MKKIVKRRHILCILTESFFAFSIYKKNTMGYNKTDEKRNL